MDTAEATMEAEARKIEVAMGVAVVEVVELLVEEVEVVVEVAAEVAAEVVVEVVAEVEAAVSTLIEGDKSEEEEEFEATSEHCNRISARNRVSLHTWVHDAGKQLPAVIANVRAVDRAIHPSWRGELCLAPSMRL